ncbi:MAG: GNAT family N-acetyltransferase [Phycisphaeraceae bacterium]|nr:GNAT family N-acetyltransferase [Phycisphaeraceae bacterium]MBX3407994.1 GNAT family N-acetyltransferase [Phycisphaeraceae bacterium]
MDMLEIARLEEGRQAEALSELADEVLSIGGGIAGRGAPGSWLNNANNIGMAGPVHDDDAERIIDWYQSAGIEPRVELCPYADESLVAALAARGFVVRMFESVLFREIDPRETVRPVVTPPPGLEIRRLDPANDAEVREYAVVCASGFLPPGMTDLPPDHLEVSMRAARHPRSVGLMAMLDGRCVGAGGMGLHTNVAALFGLSVLPEFRRRGIQQALIAARLNIAAQMGRRLATIGSRPGAGTERNVRRMGFQTAYVKPIVVRPGPGLAPNLG